MNLLFKALEDYLEQEEVQWSADFFDELWLSMRPDAPSRSFISTFLIYIFAAAVRAGDIGMQAGVDMPWRKGVDLDEDEIPMEHWVAFRHEQEDHADKDVNPCSDEFIACLSA